MGEARNRDPLLILRHGEDSGRPGTERDEADRPERDHARVADEDVERDDDRDLDQRVEEIGLEVARDLEAEQRRRDDERRRHEELREPPQRHTRSTAPPARAKSPLGRTSSTTITAAKMKLFRYWLWLVGRIPPRRP